MRTNLLSMLVGVLLGSIVFAGAEFVVNIRVQQEISDGSDH